MKTLIFFFSFFLFPFAFAQQGKVCDKQWEAFHLGLDISDLKISKITHFGGIKCSVGDEPEYSLWDIEKDRKACVKEKIEHFQGNTTVCSGNITHVYPAWCTRPDGSTYNHSFVTIRERNVGVGCSYPKCERFTDVFWLKR